MSMTIEEAIPKVVKTLQAGVAENMVLAALLFDGFLEQQARVIVRWARQSIRAEASSMPETNDPFIAERKS